MAQMSPLNGLMLLSILIVVVGTLLSCSYELANELFTVDVDVMYMFGVAMALLATMSIALRNVMEEIIFANCKNIDPLLFSASYGLFGTGLIGAMLLVAQVLPGPDNGVQALIDSFRIYPRCAIELFRSSLILTSSHPPRS
jgi:hypothetical protein